VLSSPSSRLASAVLTPSPLAFAGSIRPITKSKVTKVRIHFEFFIITEILRQTINTDKFLKRSILTVLFDY